MKLLEIKDFSLDFPKNGFRAINNISFDINEGEILALVGESGSGKSLTALSILGLEPANSVKSGRITFKDKILTASSYPPSLRGKEIAYIPQDPLSSLNPVYRIQNQIFEAIEIYNPQLKHEEKYQRSFEALKACGIADPERCLKAYPHELSGGMRQRIMIAMAIINNPSLLIADEPTTALDVTVQAIILELLKSLKKTILFITHDLGVVAELADRVLVMKQGSIVEEADVYKLFANPQQSYTQELLKAVPRL